MLANHEMKANRFGRQAKARRQYREILEHIELGGRVYVGSYTKPKIYSKAAQFRRGKYDVYAALGKNWDSLIWSPIVFID